MTMSNTKEKILDVMRTARKPLAVHEFNTVTMYLKSEGDDKDVQAWQGLQFIGASENALSARLRELRAAGKVKASVRKDKTFKEWSLVETTVPAVPA